MSKEKIFVLDFGGQYNQLIARRVRDNGVYCEIHSYKMPIEEIKAAAPSGIILTGGPNSVYGDDAILADPKLFELGIPTVSYTHLDVYKRQDNSKEVTPVPISNTEVKLLSAYDTWWVTAWESGSLPV